MFWTRTILWKIIKVLEYLIGMVRYYPARKKKYFFVPYLTRPHVLRHTACIRMAECHRDMKALQYIMGHAHFDVTMEVYNHLGDRARIEKEVAAISGSKQTVLRSKTDAMRSERTNLDY